MPTDPREPGLTGGEREMTAATLARDMVKAGTLLPDILDSLRAWNRDRCKPPLEERELLIAVEGSFRAVTSVTAVTGVTGGNGRLHGVTSESQAHNSRVTGTTDSVSFLVGQFIEQAQGIFTVGEIYQATGLTSPQDRNAVRQALLREKKRHKIENAGGRNGYWRRVESECQAIDFRTADTTPASLALPFKLHELVEIMPGNIIVLAGEPNAGKTAFLLNAVRENMVNWQVHYFNSEMGASELRKRLSKFDTPLESWHFNAWERTDNFQDAIRSGPGVLNIIDFLEVHEDFYKVGGQLAAIHAKLNGAVAIVALQKNRGTDIGRGGGMSLEKPRLYLAMEPGKIKIVKAKNWRAFKNPNGLELSFKLADGCRIMPQGNWTKPEEKAARAA